MDKLDSIKVISPVSDDKIQEHIKESPIWHNAFLEQEITNEIYHKYPNWYMYSIKFNGLIPIQCTDKQIYFKPIK